MNEDKVYLNDLEKKSSKSKSKIILICFVLLIILLIFIFIFFVPKIELFGSSYVKVEYGDLYKEAGYVAKYRGTDITDKVWIEGKINEEKIGIYNIKYKVRKNRIVVTKERKVEIVDTVAPVVTLLGDSSVNVCPNKEYIEDGYTAVDNYDGDLSNSVEVKVNDKDILYSVQDSSGNYVSVKRSIIKADETMPVITLKGGNNNYIVVGTKYVDPGYTAYDDCDGDLTNNVSIVGNVNYEKVGVYELTYSVKDSSGNFTSIIRKVTVTNKITTNAAKKGTIYLTFDDGPSGTITSKLLDILKEKNVKATFFVINHSNNLDYLIKREYDEGHTVALHSMTHSYPTIYSSVEAYFNDLNLISNKVYSLTGEKSMIIRFPGGSSNTISRNYSKGIMRTLTNEVLNRGYHYFDWNVSSGDAGGAKNSSDVYNNVVKNLSKNRANIVLMHDFENNYKTLNAISDIIDYGKANGYEFLSIDMSTSMVRHSVNN